VTAATTGTITDGGAGIDTGTYCSQ
jgi:hypothetical protein